MEDLFFKVLNEKNKDLLEIASKKKYTFMVPLSKFITPNMLIRPFYDNHTFYASEYDDKIHINLNGRALEYKNNQFQSYIGFKKQMNFNIIDESMREINNCYIKVIYIDNIIDETVYNSTNIILNPNKKETLKRFNNKEDYVKYFNNLLKSNDELKEIDIALNELIERMQNNYILMKNHVHTYSKYFQELGSDFRLFVGNKLSKFKIDESFNLIIYELTESLVFNKIYQFLYFNIKQFNIDDEAEIKSKMNLLKNDFSFTLYKLDSIFNECKFKNAVNEIKNINKFSTPFEKLVNKNLFLESFKSGE